MQVTKNVNFVPCDYEMMQKVVLEDQINKLDIALKKVKKTINMVELLKKNEWIKLKNKNAYYVASENLIIPDIRKVPLKSDEFINKFEGFCGDFMTSSQVLNLFFENKFKNPMFEKDSYGIISNNISYVNFFGKNDDINENELDMKDVLLLNYIKSSDIVKSPQYLCINSINGKCCKSEEFCTNSCGVAIPVLNMKKDKFLLQLMAQHEFRIDIPDNELYQNVELIIDLIKKDYIYISKERITFSDKLYKLVFNGNLNEIMEIAVSIDAIRKDLFEEFKLIDNKISNILIDYLLNCDKLRADIQTYDKTIVKEVDRGHWDLWDIENSEYIKANINKVLIARNPEMDIVENGIIGIDFGTKSTIITRFNNGEIIPIRIGNGDFSQEPKLSDYENPTVMQFIHLEKFLNDYNEKLGRPFTKWKDLKVSHTAFNNWIKESETKDYNEFFGDLKRWVSSKGTNIIIKDKDNYEKILKDYLDIQDNFDPIEIYAYYLGLYINNMRNGIYMEYVMSLPVLFEKSLSDKLIESFTKGIKKSLPESIIKNPNLMKKFKVSKGVSEPAAYAVCALQQYNFETENENNIYYGVFDFGGGTTDFDFGVWKEGKGRRIENTITHFGAGGDKYLGGENLLELLAFEVFSKNLDTLRKSRISFTRPYKSYMPLGAEMLINNNSQSARLNMRRLKEKLRAFWERHDNYMSIFEKGIIYIDLFDNDGNKVQNIQLFFNQKDLENILEKRIEKGVKNFFISLEQTFLNKDENIDKVIIFLAGNSSKSPIVKDIFNKYINIYEKLIDEKKLASQVNNNLNSDNKQEQVNKDLEKQLNIENNNFNLDNKYNEKKIIENSNKYFEVLPPLGTKEADEIQSKKGILISKNIWKPNGKTGVAYGLLQCRKGGKVQVFLDKKREVKFRYFIGYSKKNKFQPIITSNSEFNKWVLLFDASDKEFEFYYTTLPEAISGEMKIGEDTFIIRRNTGIKRADANIYIRISSSTTIDYVVATNEGIKSEKYLCNIVRIELD